MRRSRQVCSTNSARVASLSFSMAAASRTPISSTGSAFAERAKPKAVLAFDGVALTAPLSVARFVRCVGRDVDLLRNEPQHGRRRPLAGT